MGLVLSLIVPAALAEVPAQELPRTGLLPPSAEDLAWARKHLIIGRSVKLNALGLERINAAAAATGKPVISAAGLNVVPFGSEVEGLTEEQEAVVAPPPTGKVGTAVATSPIVPLALPAAVDNSLLNAFPPIGNQGGVNSCVPFSVTYYTLTHMVSLANGINAKAGGTAAALSPKFVYNLFNGGSDGGGSVHQAMQVIMNHGAPHWVNFPYDSNVTAWPLSASIWREAISSRTRSMGWIADVNTPAGLENLKTMLANGYVLNFEAYAPYDSNWEKMDIRDDPATTADDAFVGQKICRQVTFSLVRHAMTIVGYNDNLWLDINGNGFVDTGEKGALKIANSWGTGYWNSGFYWVAYDAMQFPTKVQGWTQSATRQPAFISNPYWMSVQPGYTPSHLAEITVSHRYRNQLMLVLGISGLDTTTPRKGWYPNLYYNGGAYAFDGGSTEKECNFVLDFSDIVKSPASNRWYLTFGDSSSGSTGTLKSYTLVATSPSNRVVYAGTTMPTTFDYTQRVIWVNYGTTSTVADVTAPPVITTLGVTGAGANRADLRWQEVGDDSTNDWFVVGYDLRYSTNDLSESTWVAATQWTGSLPPGEPSAWKSTTVTGLTPNTTYFFAVKAWDDAGNTNGISNVATGTTATTLEFAGVTNPLPVATRGSAYRYQMNATGGVPAYRWSDDWMNGLPNSLNIDYYAGLIAGTVSASTGLYTVAINLRDQSNQQVSSNFVMEVIASDTNAGALRFAVTNVVVAETAGVVTTSVTRVGGAVGSVSAQFLVGDRTGSDSYGNGLYAISTNGTLQWADGDASSRTLLVNFEPDNLVTTRVVEAVLFNAGGGAVISTGSVCRLTLTDDDPALEVTPTNGLYVAEGGTSTLAVRLTRVPPAGPVSVTAAIKAGSDLDLVVTTGTNLTFTAGTWSNWQTVVVSALEDGDQDSGTGRVDVALAGAPTVSVPVAEFDNDIQIMTTTNWVMLGTDTNRTIGVKLATAPPQAVTVTVARVSGSTNIIVGSGTPALFAATNWNAWRAVNISALLAGRAMNVEATLRGSSARALSTDVLVSAPLVTAAYGTPYWWLSTQAGATNFATDELLDIDHDGAAAWQEYRAGTAPSNAVSVFRILRMDATGTVSRLWWYGTTNSGVTTPFIIECGPHVGVTNGWADVSPELGRSGTGTNEWQHSPSLTSGPAFYRVRIKE
jgi:hypothetical protein